MHETLWYLIVGTVLLGMGVATSALRPQLFLPAQRVEREQRPDRNQRAEMLAVAHHDERDADLAAVLQRVAQQRVDLLALAVRHEVARW